MHYHEGGLSLTVHFLNADGRDDAHDQHTEEQLFVRNHEDSDGQERKQGVEVNNSKHTAVLLILPYAIGLIN